MEKSTPQTIAQSEVGSLVNSRNGSKLAELASEVLKSEDKSLQKATSGNRLSVLPESPTDPKRAMAIARIVGEVEIAKACNPPFTQQQKDALVRLIHGEGWGEAEIVRRARAVIRRHTFGSIAFEHWKTDDEEAASEIKARFQCSYCGTEWWGLGGSNCPTCFD